MNKANAIKNAKLKSSGIETYVPHYTTSMEQQKIISKKKLSKTPTGLQYVEGSIFMEEVNTLIFWTFKLWTQPGTNDPIWIVVGFQQRDRQDSQN